MPSRLSIPAPSPGRSPGRLGAALYAYTFLDDFVVLYPVYALLFARAGLSVAQISSLFIIWSVTGFALEVPAGVCADVLPRRLLLAAGPLLGACGFALWTAFPFYWSFAAGFALWGAEGALQSGAMEALVYEELDCSGAVGRYARTMGRARVAGVCGVMAAAAAAGPVLAAGGYAAVGVASMLARLACAGAAIAFPEHRSHGAAEGIPGWEGAVAGRLSSWRAETVSGGVGYLQALRSALREVRTDRSVLRALLLVPAVTAVWGGLEEYDPLLARSTGVAPRTVPLLILLISAGVALGGLLAALGRATTTRALAGILALGALALASGALSGRPAGFILIAAAFSAFQLASVAADARMQARITGPARATVTSLASLGTEVATILVFGAYAAASAFAANRMIFALFAVPYLVVAGVLAHATSTLARARAVPSPVSIRRRLSRSGWCGRRARPR